MYVYACMYIYVEGWNKVYMYTLAFTKPPLIAGVPRDFNDAGGVECGVPIVWLDARQASAC